MALSSITVSGITPDLAILGAYQRFIFPSTINSCTLGTKNTFVPTVSNDSITNLEMMNTGLNGFRWVHATTSAGTFGNLTFQSFIGATPTNIWGTGEGGTFTIFLPTTFSQNINMGAFKITNLGTPTAGTDAATKSYVDTAPNLPITLTGAVTGTGTSTIATSYNGTVGVTNGGTGITSTTAYSVVCGGTTSTGPLQSVSGLGNTGEVLTSSGNGVLPAWAPAGAGTVTSITAGSGLTGGVITSSGTISLSSPVSLNNGGTNASLTASNGGLFYSTAGAGAILAGTATAQQIVLSGANAAPSWSTATYPSTTTVNQILYSSATNTISQLTTANNGALITSAAGVPSISSTLPSAVQGNITSVGTVTSGIWNGTTIAVPNGGTGVASSTAYAVKCGGTTSTGPMQSVSGVGTTGQMLTSAGAGALPTWATYNPGYASLRMSTNATAVTITTAGTYYKVPGLTITQFANIFTTDDANTPNRITSPVAINAVVNVTLSAIHSGAQQDLTFAIYKNGTSQTNIAANRATCLGASGYQTYALTGIISLAATDYIEVWTTGDTNGRTTTVTDLNFMVRALTM